MGIDQWPCIPDSLADFLNEDMIRFVIAGAAEKYGIAISIVEASGQRYDPFNLEQNYQPFCKFFRHHRENGEAAFPGADDACREWDKMVAQDFLQRTDIPLKVPQDSPCWMGLQDYVVIMETGGYRYALLTGQYLHEEGKPSRLDQVHTAVDKWARERKFKDCGPLNELKAKVAEHRVCTQDDKQWLCDAVRDINEIFDGYWKKQRDINQGQILGWLSTELAQLTTSGKEPNWQALETILGQLSERLGCRQVLLFASESRRAQRSPENILRLKASVGLPQVNREARPHLNWQKAGCAGYGRALVLDPKSRDPIWKRGIRRDNVPQVQPGNVLRALGDEATGLRCVVTVGQFDALEQATSEDVREFLDQLLTRICERVQRLLLQASLEHSEDSLRKGRDFLAHQVRSRLDVIVGYQETVRELLQGIEDRGYFDVTDGNLTTAIADLQEFSNLAHRDEPLLGDPTKLHREVITVPAIIEAALDHHASYAEAEEVDLLTGKISSAPVEIDPFWLRTMLIHLVHNAIKYSREPLRGGTRWVNLRAEQVGQDLVIEVENFGLGILPEYLETIFEKGTRIIEGTRFERTPGMGRGLWEARRIAHVFGGKVQARSRHHSGDLVTRENINECITTVSVVLPVHTRTEGRE